MFIDLGNKIRDSSKGRHLPICRSYGASKLRTQFFYKHSALLELNTIGLASKLTQCSLRSNLI